MNHDMPHMPPPGIAMGMPGLNTFYVLPFLPSKGAQVTHHVANDL